MENQTYNNECLGNRENVFFNESGTVQNASNGIVWKQPKPEIGRGSHKTKNDAKTSNLGVKNNKGRFKSKKMKHNLQRNKITEYFEILGRNKPELNRSKNFEPNESGGREMATGMGGGGGGDDFWTGQGVGETQAGLVAFTFSLESTRT